MGRSLIIAIVPEAECEGHHIDLFMARGLHPKIIRYCNTCAEDKRGEIRSVIHDAFMDDSEGVPI